MVQQAMAEYGEPTISLAELRELMARQPLRQSLSDAIVQERESSL